MEKKFYYCFSHKQKLYLDELDFIAIEERIHNKTKKSFWVYEITETLTVALKAWSYNGRLLKGNQIQKDAESIY